MSEKEKISFTPETGEKPINIVDVQKTEHLSNEVKDWMERVETNNIQTDIMSDLVEKANEIKTNTQTKNDLTTLPVSKSTFTAGFKSSIQEAHRWLSEFILRTIKLKKGKVQFKEE